MKKYNIQNYIRYKEDLKTSMPDDKFYDYYTRDELVIKFMPLVENLARKFSTSQQASGVLTINDLIQIGNEGLTRAVDKLEWDKLKESEDIEKTLKSFFSKRIKGLIRRRIDACRGDIRIPEHKMNEIRKNPKDKKMVAMFFNSVFLSIDAQPTNEYGENMMLELPDKSEPYNIALLNIYLKGLMQKHLNENEYEALRLSYG
jgi:RNA polymerase sigma factor (sigma-70 family)